MVTAVSTRRSRATTTAVLVPAAALVAATASVVRPDAVLWAIGAAAVVGAMVFRLRWALLVYVAVEPFGDLLGGIHPAFVKAVGVLLFAAWALRLLLDHRPVALRHPGMYAAGALLLVVLASLVADGVPGHGVEVALRYASYLGVLAVLVDTIRAAGPDRAGFVRRVAGVFVVSCTAAAVVGLGGFLVAGGRAAGPMEDANDFAFFLISALPLALWLARGPGVSARLHGVCAVVLIVGTLATFSRGALLGIGVMAVLALALGLLRRRTLVLGAAVVAVAVVVAWVAVPDLIDRSLQEKQYVAADNVDSRFTTWSMAAAMTAERPLLGQGPGGFGTEADRFVPAGTSDTTQQSVAHQMYLDVASELGLMGITAFLLVFAHAVLGAVRARRVPETGGPATAVLVGFGGTLVAACFLTEQYYLPLWLFSALGVALDPAWRDPVPSTAEVV